MCSDVMDVWKHPVSGKCVIHVDSITLDFVVAISIDDSTCQSTESSLMRNGRAIAW